MGGTADAGTESFGTLLRRYRGARSLTQEELAERAGLHVQEISKLERGVLRNPRATTVEFLAGALKLDAGQKEGFLAAAAGLTGAQALLAFMATDVLPPRAPELPPGSVMPLAPNPLFVGRGEELLRVARALQGGATVAVGQVVASTGLGGLGKTQLAVELVHRYGRFFAGGVYWLSFASAEEIPFQVAACARTGAMDLASGVESLPLEERVHRVRQAWQSAVPRLLVFDNCEDETLLEAWRPPSGGCRVLVTSRRSHWSPTLGVTELPLDLLPRPDSVELLRRYRPDLAADDPGLDAIARELGDLPLALHLAASYLRAYQAELGPCDYLAELRRSEVVKHASLLGAGVDGPHSPTRHVQSLAQTFAVSLARLDREREVDRIAIALLARMACMAPGEPVPRGVLDATLEEVSPLLRVDAVRRLAAIGLMETGAGWLRQHRLLVHFVRQLDLDAGARRAVDRMLVERGEAAAAGSLSSAELSAIIPHLHDVVGPDGRDEERQARVCYAAGRILYEAGDLPATRPWYERALAACERAFGQNHAHTATCLLGLGRLNQEQGSFDVAGPLLERAAGISERVLGAEHPDTVRSLMYLAWFLHVVGDASAARRTAERALAICQRTSGSEHPDTAQCLDILGAILFANADVAGARGLLERALAAREKGFGPDHHLTARSLNNLALLLMDQGELTAARPLLERALEIGERELGADHYLTSAYLDSLAELVAELGEHDEAKRLAERALVIRERALGPDHPWTAEILQTLALVLRARGEPAAARPLLVRALAIRERVLGPDHLDTAATRRALAQLDGTR